LISTTDCSGSISASVKFMTFHELLKMFAKRFNAMGKMS